MKYRQGGKMVRGYFKQIVRQVHETVPWNNGLCGIIKDFGKKRLSMKAI